MHLIIILVEKLASILKRLPTNRQTNELKFNFKLIICLDFWKFWKILECSSVPGIEILSLIQAALKYEVPGVSYLWKFWTKMILWYIKNKISCDFRRKNGMFSDKIKAIGVFFIFQQKTCMSIFNIFWWNYRSANRFN